MSDIVERLREHGDKFPIKNSAEWIDFASLYLVEAAAEIERLRAALREVLEQADINDLDKEVLDRALAALGEPLPKHWVRREP